MDLVIMSGRPRHSDAFTHGAPPMSADAPANPSVAHANGDDPNGGDTAEAARLALRRLVTLMARQAAREMFDAATPSKERDA